MLRLVLFRHAKSSWANAEISDFERPLNDRGRHDAPFMASRIRTLVDKDAYLLSSPACRAAATARLIAKSWKMDEDAIFYNAALYHASLQSLWQQILQLTVLNKTVVVFGHNEGLTELAESCSQGVISHLPTAGVAVFDFDVAHWSELKQEKASLIGFYYPKQA